MEGFDSETFAVVRVSILWFLFGAKITRHFLNFSAFGWKPPKFAHLPLLVHADGHKLSKRDNSSSIEYYRSKGVFPQALINYVSGPGGGFHRKSAEPQSHSMEELQEMFDLKSLNLHPSGLNPELLDQFNRLEIERQVEDPVRCEELVERVRELITKAYPDE